MKNEITNLSQFFETIIQPSFSFKSLKHCRQTTAEELNITTLDLIRQLSPMDNDNVISNDPINVLKT